MAAALLQHALAAQPEPLRSLKVTSAGVSARRGEAVSENSVIALRKVGIDLSKHVSQPLTQELLDRAVAVICMTESHRTMIEIQAEPPPAEIHLFREFMEDGQKEIMDPFGCSLKVYEACRDEMVEAIPSLVGYLKTRLSSGSAS
jgi:protein-tyrosine-phosphatase